ncbi:MAG: hypothetical protein WC012_06935 [Thiohalomonadaceae bacterium]
MRKVQQKLAKDIHKHFEMEKEARALADPSFSPEQLVCSLVEHEQFYSAVVFLAHALPKREAVWWACLCARTTITEDSSSDDIAALKSAERWVFTPTEENRRLAEKLAEKTEFLTPASWAATAAFWSGGSITGEQDTPVPPAPYLYAHAVAGAVNLSATFDARRNAEDLYRLFISQAMNIADGGNGELAA